ncbi:hypothetical protein FACS1894187_15720 [Synergistales bacterium]|nr:hypothetical protein FACS1894187_15720 [Synergistales bacterium]
MKKITKCVLSALMMVSVLSGVADAKIAVFKPERGAEARIDRHGDWDGQRQDREREQRRRMAEERQRRWRQRERERREREAARMRRHHHMNHFYR